MRIELPEGNWADGRPPADLYDADRKKVLSAMSFRIDPVTGERTYQAVMDDAVADAMLEAVVESWSYTHLPIPAKDRKSIGKLRIAHSRALRDGIAGHMRVVYGQDEPGENPTQSPISSSGLRGEDMTPAGSTGIATSI